MKISYRLLFLIAFISACQSERDDYTANSVTYNLFQSSEYGYSGVATARELRNGDVELTLKLTGPSSSDPYFFPAHLHFGSYDKPDAEIAFLLNPIDITTLESKTILGKLSDGSDLTFSELRIFDGHLKIHLADEGPDYSVILVTGNVGINENSIESFSNEKVSLCIPNYPN
nr:hypothetical protein [Cytophagales bacterium]